MISSAIGLRQIHRPMKATTSSAEQDQQADRGNPAHAVPAAAVVHDDRLDQATPSASPVRIAVVIVAMPLIPGSNPPSPPTVP